MLVDWFQNHPMFSIVLGAALIGIGGLIGTLGWEGRSASTARRAILEVLAAEVQVNEALLSHSVFTETDPEKLQVIRVIPSFHDSALRAAISSGAFSRKTDQDLLDSIAALENSIIYFRQLTEVYHGLLIKTSSFPNMEHRNREFRKLWLGLREAASLAQLRDNIQTLQNVIGRIEPGVVVRPGWLKLREESVPQGSPDATEEDKRSEN
jgi:hypothetical protein